jgi:hypothetical protein
MAPWKEEPAKLQSGDTIASVLNIRIAIIRDGMRGAGGP